MEIGPSPDWPLMLGWAMLSCVPGVGASLHLAALGLFQLGALFYFVA